MSSASALLASRWPALYSQGLIAVEEAAEPDPSFQSKRERAKKDYQKRTQRRKAAGHCTKCECPHLPGKTLCERHAAEWVAYMRARREKVN